MRKNMLMIHLESLNQIIYRMNYKLFPNINRIVRESYGFDKYFSSATSTIMVAADLVDGGTYQYEKNTTVVDKKNEVLRKGLLFDELRTEGFFVKKYAYPIDSYDKEWDLVTQMNFFGKSLPIDSFNDEQELLHILEKDLSENDSYAIWCCNYISNMASRGLVVDKNDYSGSQLWRMGYQMLDDFVGKLFDILARTKHIDDTMVVLYGDHGDEFWGKHSHAGLVHAIEPYAELIHTPLWIWGIGKKGVNNNKLVSTADLKNVIINLLLDGAKDVEQLVASRKYVFARNEYAAQPCRTESFNKSYGITDGIFLLIVSGLGLEMYEIEMDPGCKCNYLSWFDLKSDGVLKFNESILRENTYHFPSFMNQKEMSLIRQKFYRMKKLLYCFVRERYYDAELSDVDIQHEMDFQSIRCK